MRSLERDGVRLAFDEAGDGPPLVMLHGFLADRRLWRAQADALVDSYRVVLPDMRGHGESGPSPPGVGFEDLVADVVAILDELEIREAVWAGLSIGGMIALRGALWEPERVRALVLVDTDAGSESLGNRIRYRALGLAARLVGLRPLRGAIARLMFGGTSLSERPELVATWRERLVRVDLPSALAILGPLVGRDSLMQEVADIEVPALVLVGSEDTTLPPDRSEQLARSLRHARFRTIPKAGHVSTVERPEAVTEAMREFLAGVTSPGAAGR